MSTFATRIWSVTALILVSTGLVLGVVTYRTMAGHETQRAIVRFDRSIGRAADSLERTVSTCLETLYPLRALFHGSQNVSREEFAIVTREILSRHPSIQAMEWAPRIPVSERESHEGEARHDGLEGYEITEMAAPGRMVRASPRAVHFPVFYVEPLAGNESALGFDLAADPTRRAALSRAMEGELATLSDPIVPVQEKGSSTGVLGVLPIRSRSASAERVDLESVRGYVLVALRIDEILRQSLLSSGNEDLRVAFELFDDNVRGTPKLLYAASGPAQERAAGPAASRKRIQVGGQEWQLIASPSTAYLAENRTLQPETTGAAIVLLMGAISGFFVLLGKRSRGDALREQDRKTRAVLHGLVEGVVVADDMGEFVLMNRAAERILGKDKLVPAAEWPSSYGWYLPDAMTPYPATRSPLARAIDGEHVPEETVCVRGPEASGTTWLSVRGAPLKDRDGASLGGVVFLREVTESMKRGQLTQRLAEVVCQTGDAVLITDRQASILYVNPAFEAVTGYSSKEAVGKTPRILKSGRHDRAHYEKLWSTVLAGTTYQGSTINRKKNGEIYYSEQTITPMRDEGGRITHFVSVYRDMTERRRIQEQEIEVRVAATVQRRLYPRTPPRIEGLDIAGAVFSADVTHGDYFDFVRMRDDVIGIAIGDVVGHGLGAALVMVETCAYVRSFAQVDRDPSEVLRKVNRALASEAKDVMFVSLLLACVERSTRKLVWANAGHTPGYVLDERGAVRRELAPTGPALGLLAEGAYGPSEELVLELGDTVLLLTDGVTESPRPGGARFEAEGALEVVRAHRHESAAQIIDHLHAAEVASRGGLARRDDMTLVVFKPCPHRLAAVPNAHSAPDLERSCASRPPAQS